MDRERKREGVVLCRTSVDGWCLKADRARGAAADFRPPHTGRGGTDREGCRWRVFHGSAGLSCSILHAEDGVGGIHYWNEIWDDVRRNDAGT